MSRTIVIGDLHGCYDEALELLARVGATSTDRIIFTGDLVDRGPRRRECVELAMRHECILGNHEEKHLQQRRRRDADLLPDHLETRQALGPEHLDYFATLPHFIRLPEYQAVVVHAGVLPGRTLEEQEPYHLLHVQCVRPPERKSYWPSKAPEGYRFWTHDWKGPERVIFGHTVFDRPLVTEHAVGIDTGCVYGHSLTALVLPTWELVSVPARKAWRAGKDVALLPVHPGVNVFS
jgi:serine/threonine protein phosphatase 1